MTTITPTASRDLVRVADSIGPQWWADAAELNAALASWTVSWTDCLDRRLVAPEDGYSILCSQVTPQEAPEDYSEDVRDEYPSLTYEAQSQEWIQSRGELPWPAR